MPLNRKLQEQQAAEEAKTVPTSVDSSSSAAVFDLSTDVSTDQVLKRIESLVGDQPATSSSYEHRRPSSPSPIFASLSSIKVDSAWDNQTSNSPSYPDYQPQLEFASLTLPLIAPTPPSFSPKPVHTQSGTYYARPTLSSFPSAPYNQPSPSASSQLSSALSHVSSSRMQASHNESYSAPSPTNFLSSFPPSNLPIGQGVSVSSPYLASTTASNGHRPPESNERWTDSVSVYTPGLHTTVTTSASSIETRGNRIEDVMDRSVAMLIVRAFFDYVWALTP